MKPECEAQTSASFSVLWVAEEQSFQFSIEGIKDHSGDRVGWEIGLVKEFVKQLQT